MTYQRTIMMD